MIFIHLMNFSVFYSAEGVHLRHDMQGMSLPGQRIPEADLDK